MISFDAPLMALVRPPFVLAHRTLSMVIGPTAATWAIGLLLLWAAYYCAKKAGGAKLGKRALIAGVVVAFIGYAVGHG